MQPGNQLLYSSKIVRYNSFVTLSNLSIADIPNSEYALKSGQNI